MEYEVHKLLKGGIIGEAEFPEWIFNAVVVRKKNDNWRVCVDFTNLSKTCPKVSFPLLRIDQPVDSAVGHERMSFFRCILRLPSDPYIQS